MLAFAIIAVLSPLTLLIDVYNAVALAVQTSERADVIFSPLRYVSTFSFT